LLHLEHISSKPLVKVAGAIDDSAHAGSPVHPLFRLIFVCESQLVSTAARSPVANYARGYDMNVAIFLWLRKL
jgi:hypothetical protein